MKRIKMEEKTIAMEGRRGKRRGEDGEREEGKKMEGAKGSQEEAGSVFSSGARRRKWPVSGFQR